MGYFANGFVFTSEPDFKAMSATNPGRFARGYKHKKNSIWLLDFWKPRGKLLLRKAPFCDPAAEGFRMDTGSVDAPTRTFLAILQRLKAFLERRFPDPDPEFGNVHLALAVAAAARCPAFFFAADDEDLDMGCRTVPGSLVSFGCRLDWLSIRYHDGQVTVTPLNYFLTDYENIFEEMIVKLKGVADISVLPPREIENGLTLYENPVRQWPKAAGDPAEILGLGTWNPLVSVETDFTIVFEQLTM